MRVGFTGDVVINVVETSGLVADLSLSFVVVSVVVVAAIVLFYEWWLSILILLPPLLLACVYTFAVCSLPPFDVTELNSNTAFLGSIIVGNGINFGIILLARFRRRATGRGDARDACCRAVVGAPARGRCRRRWRPGCRTRRSRSPTFAGSGSSGSSAGSGWCSRGRWRSC